MNTEKQVFYVKGYHMPVCARCVGADIGYVLGAFAYLKYGFGKIKYIAVMGLEIMFFDWFLRLIKIKDTCNIKKVLTGVCGGFATAVFCLKLFFMITKKKE